MKKIILIVICVLFYNFKSYSQDITGKWKISLLSDSDVETYSDVYWEFTTDGKCIERMLDDNSVYDTHTYTLSHTTCNDGVQDKDLHLSLINLRSSYKSCFVFNGMNTVDNRTTMSITNYEEAAPILLVKQPYTNTSQSVVFTKNDCPLGSEASMSTYFVKEGKYSSTISQSDADAQAQADILANAQKYANDNGKCIFRNKAQRGIYRKNICPSGSVALEVPYDVAAGVYLSYISQSDADAQAQSEILSNGQKNANAKGSCIFNSKALTNVGFTKRYCPSPKKGSLVPISLPPGAFVSFVSQADADAQAQNAAQQMADSRGSCN